MVNTTSINLGNHFKGFISNFPESGRYGFASEAVQAVIEAKKSGDSSLTHRQIIEQAKVELDTR
jgi:Arc/MetJ-type ribon-helix-helix transcriptional regulator